MYIVREGGVFPKQTLINLPVCGTVVRKKKKSKFQLLKDISALVVNKLIPGGCGCLIPRKCC